MSWHIKVAGPKEEVVALIAGDAQIPKPVKEHIIALVEGLKLDATGYGHKLQAFVDTQGHCDSGSGDYTVKVLRIAAGLAKPPES